MFYILQDENRKVQIQNLFLFNPVRVEFCVHHIVSVCKMEAKKSPCRVQKASAKKPVTETFLKEIQNDCPKHMIVCCGKTWMFNFYFAFVVRLRRSRQLMTRATFSQTATHLSMQCSNNMNFP